MASRRMSGDAVLSNWLRLLPDEWRLRPMQRRGLEIMARDEDLLVIDRTGGGKSLLFQLPAIADWVVEVERGDELPSITLLVVPFVSDSQGFRQTGLGFRRVRGAGSAHCAYLTHSREASLE
eukprot:CAMPEP_0185392280 /NCGR_PEP_ID=MMETSP1364-20130426/76147_1 /TAXON_ID=38817 /ORGANISM="Gephyrocapsa oceanica, Strain RCC1303" /LENGTH=121 /DNA_ID=CAMNT_0027994315 /DNA_START=8 /DNA_END=371 /DNA_ORIENTATION=+